MRIATLTPIGKRRMIMFFKVSRTNTNKLVSYVDRYFTYDRRTLKREGECLWFDFFGVRQDDERKIIVVVDRMKNGVLWVSIRDNDTYIHSGYIKSFKDIDIFKRMVRCLG